MVWELILPKRTESSEFGKWSPTWEGPFRINRYVPSNAYILETLEGEEYSKALNEKYLKKYYTSVWVDMHSRLSKRSVEFKIADAESVSPLA